MNENREYEKSILGYMIDKLDELEDREILKEDLIEEMMYGDNVSGCISIYTQDAINFIKNNWDKASEAFEYYKENGIIINPFENPHKFELFMYDKELRDRIDKVDLDDIFPGETIVMDEETIKKIKEVTGIEARYNEIEEQEKNPWGDFSEKKENERE